MTSNDRVRNTSKRRWKIVSGGQTGVDRAGLVAAMSAGLPFGGWVPQGRRAEDGIVSMAFHAMRESANPGYRWRTRANIQDSDATLILADSVPLNGGTALTAAIAEELRKPCKIVCLGADDTAAQIRDWMLSLEWSVPERPFGQIVLNVAGPRESKAPGIFKRARQVLEEVFADFQNEGGGDFYSMDTGRETLPMVAESPEPPDANEPRTV